MTVNGPSETQLTLQTWYSGSVTTGRTTYKGRQDCVYGAQYKFFFNPSGSTMGEKGTPIGCSIISSDAVTNTVIVQATSNKVGFTTAYSDRYGSSETWYDVTAMYKLS